MKPSKERKKPAWVSTDSSTNQYGRQLNTKIYEFKQPDINNGKPVTVDLVRYTFEQVEDCIRSYVYTQLCNIPEYCVGIYKEYGSEADWIMAECLFEMEEKPSI
jgi:hypothetical protein